MKVGVERFFWEPVMHHGLPRHKTLKRKGSQHVEAEQESCHIDH